jgi:predicted dehydrogenase
MVAMRVQWGILGTAAIAREAVIPGMRRPPYDKHAEVAAIASRCSDKAQSVAHQFAIHKSHGSYEELLADDDIDAVYIPLPNHLHVPFSIQALAAGKHVLCEKPIALSVTEAEELAGMARRHPKLKLMEAFMYRFHPQWRWVRQVVDDGRIGHVRAIQSFFSFNDDNPASILNHPEWGGGALMDIGCYSISLSRFIFRAEPIRVSGKLEFDPRFGVDRLTSGMLEFPGSSSVFTCATQLAPFQRVDVFGAYGRLQIEIPFNPPTDRSSRAWLETDGITKEVGFDVCDQYGIQMDLFSRAILDDTCVPTPIEDAIANMKVIEALVRSSAAGGWEPV